MKAKLLLVDAARGHGSVLSMTPDLNSAWMPMITFLVYISLNWWATWYPGAEPGGGGFVAQRILSSKDERHSLMATLCYNLLHYSLRPWPWILVALVSLILYPGLDDPETGYVRVMMDHLPPSLRGLMVAAFAAAYMSTIATQLNWGASYLVNDFYRRFIKKAADDRHYVRVSQAATVLLTILSAITTFYMGSIAAAWKLLIVTGAGTGGVLLLRWYWWRINAWSEVSAMVCAFAVSLWLQLGAGMNSDDPVGFAWIMIITVLTTTVVWISVTLATRPEPLETLTSFYRRTVPSAVGWGPIARLAPDVKSNASLTVDFVDWICGCVLIYGTLFGMGKLILQEYALGAMITAIGIAAGAVICWNFSRRKWDVAEPPALIEQSFTS